MRSSPACRVRRRGRPMPTSRHRRRRHCSIGPLTDAAPERGQRGASARTPCPAASAAPTRRPLPGPVTLGLWDDDPARGARRPRPPRAGRASSRPVGRPSSRARQTRRSCTRPGACGSPGTRPGRPRGDRRCARRRPAHGPRRCLPAGRPRGRGAERLRCRGAGRAARTRRSDQAVTGPQRRQPPRSWSRWRPRRRHRRRRRGPIVADNEATAERRDDTAADATPGRVDGAAGESTPSRIRRGSPPTTSGSQRPER